MRIWRPDAGDLNPNDIPDVYIYRNNTIEEYLSSSTHEKRLFLIGSKGSGKTLLLRYKAFQNQQKENRLSGTTARNQMVENLDFNFSTLSEKDLEQLADYNTWVNIWDFTIALFILRKTGIGLPEDLKELDQIFPEYFNLNNISSKILSDLPRFIYSKFFSWNVDLKARLTLVTASFSLFIDRLDQGLDQIISNDIYKYLEDEQGRNIAFRVWQHAQFGLLVSGYNFYTAVNSHLKIYATARLETLGIESQLRPNIESYCTLLTYNKTELKEIFLNNVRQTPLRYLRGISKDNLLESFFGFSVMPHPQALKPDGTPQLENVFDFLCRHTFERPREIILLGKNLFEQVIDKPDYWQLDKLKKIERIRRITNDTANLRILRGYLSEIVPGFKVEYLQLCVEAFAQNLASRMQVDEVKQDGILDYLYRIGLIGFNFNGRQRFLPAGQYIHDYFQVIQESDYYFLHPTLDRTLQASIAFHNFYSSHNIIGKDYPFKSPPPYKINSIANRALADFIPKAIPGRGNWTYNWENTGIKVPMQEIFQAYFIRMNNAALIDFREAQLKKSHLLLSIITNLQFARILSKRFNTNHSKWEKEELEKLATLKEDHVFTAAVDDLSFESLQKFGYRLCGRLVCLGLLLINRLGYSDIHTILNQYHFEVSGHNHIKEVSALPFLRKAFFLHGLKETAPQNDQERIHIQDGMSFFEKERLHSWHIYYKQHELLTSQHLSEPEKRYLEKSFSGIVKK